jgi:hypothetical protein
MSTTIALLIANAILGAAIGAKHSALIIIGLAPILAIVVVLGVRDIHFAPASEFAFAYLCIIVSQAAYFVTAWVKLSIFPRPMGANHGPIK